MEHKNSVDDIFMRPYCHVALREAFERYRNNTLCRIIIVVLYLSLGEA